MEDGNLENINFLNQSEEEEIIDANESEMITITDADGSLVEFEKITTINVDNSDYSYIIYTNNKIDKNGDVSIFISKETYNEDGSSFLSGIDEEDFHVVKTKLNCICKGDLLDE